MREKLDDLRFHFNEVAYTIRLRIESLSDRVKNATLSLLVLTWLAFCTFLYFNTEDYKAPEQTDIGVVVTDEVRELLANAYDAKEQGKEPEAFNTLATYRNTFGDTVDEEQMARLERMLISLASESPVADISELYANEDLVEQQPIYTFVGVVSQVDEDAMYGLTHTVSTNGDRNIEQLEVTGLTDATVGAYVTFVGVPVFESVSSPIKVQAFIMPNEEEEVE